AFLLTCVGGPTRPGRPVVLPSSVGAQLRGATGTQGWTLAASESALSGLSPGPGQVPDIMPDGTSALMIRRAEGALGPLPKNPQSSLARVDGIAIDRWFASKSDEPAWMASWFDHNPLAGGDEWWSQVGRLARAAHFRPSTRF